MTNFNAANKVNSFYKGLIITAIFLSSGMAMAEGFFTIPEGVLPKVVAWVVGIQVICFGLGKGLMMIANVTENTWDNKVAAAVSKVAATLGILIAKFGWDVPKEVVAKKAEKMGLK